MAHETALGETVEVTPRAADLIQIVGVSRGKFPPMNLHLLTEPYPNTIVRRSDEHVNSDSQAERHASPLRVRVSVERMGIEPTTFALRMLYLSFRSRMIAFISVTFMLS